ncbi:MULTISPECIES: toxin YdaT domain-containing protein [Klebsiella pneumoniae complex]|uniref:toxin YdaT domain-containing protein n=1 Tax=Klebsiella pneumoniae complex TaxID=3390273 RepID=UPI0015A74433|nr:toxin YdaT domain-containing protein [Klebsiella variicola]MCQ3874054.1 toxin YdaT domain-containing protein [Klebsiella variicola]MCQ3909425.1 toxin YdaT domain-containing protein [Klebsiella variicola]
MHALHFQQNTGANSSRLINRNQPSGQITHDQIRAVIRAWSASLDNQDVVAALVIEEWDRQGGSGLDFPDDLSRRRQKLFRWLDGETEYARENIRKLTPAILAVLPLEFRNRLMPQDDALSRLAAAIKECAEAKQAVMLNAPEHQKLKEVSEGITSLFRLMPEQAGVLMSMVTSMLGGM